MASHQAWQDKLGAAIDTRLERADVEIAMRVEADPGYPIDDFDAAGFAEWVADWVDMTMSSTAGPLMPGTNQTEWTTGDNNEVRISLLLDKRTG